MRYVLAGLAVGLLATRAAAQELSSPDLGGARLAVQAVAGLALVVGLVVLTRYLLLRLNPTGGGSVRLREVVRLSPQQALYVVEVEGRRLLVGQQVSLLCELRPAPAQAEPTFAQGLRAAARRLRRLGEEGRPCGDG